MNVKCESSNIEFLRYCEETKMLEVTFKRGVVYRYFNVTPDEWDALKHRAPNPALHVGAYFAKEIKPNHEFEKVS